MRGLDARLDRDEGLTSKKILKTSHAVRNFLSILIRSTLVKQAQNNKKIEKIKINMSKSFIAECLAMLDVRHATDDELTSKKILKNC